MVTRNRRQRKNSKLQIYAIIAIIAIALAFMASYSGQTAMFHSVGKTGQIQIQNPNIRPISIGAITGTIKNSCTGAGVITSIYLDGNRIVDSDANGRYQITTRAGSHRFEINMGPNNGLVEYDSDSSANYVTSIKEDINVQATQTLTKNYNFQQSTRAAKITTNVNNVAIPYVGSNAQDCTKGCIIAPLAPGPFSFDVKYNGQIKQAAGTLDKCKLAEVMVTF